MWKCSVDFECRALDGDDDVDKRGGKSFNSRF